MKFPGSFGPVEVYKVRQAVKNACADAGLNVTATYNFVSAVDELCCNIMEYAKADWFEISLGRAEENLQAVLRDNGVNFDPTKVIGERDKQKVFENATDRQLGLSMVGFMVDSIDHSRDAQGVNRVALTKKLGV